jgi:dipeptidyl-peptidase-4
MPDNFDPPSTQLYFFYALHRTRRTNGCESFRNGKNGLYNAIMAKDGYLYVSVEGRVLRKEERAKSIYKKIGIINIRDQAMACKKMIEQKTRTSTPNASRFMVERRRFYLRNLLFQYPEFYQNWHCRCRRSESIKLR